jgi:hypothetical protein
MGYARKNANSVGRPFVKTAEVAFGVTDLSTLQSGQWIKVGNRKPVRFIRERGTGEMFILSAPKGSRLSMAAFRLGCGNENSKVITKV